MSKQAYKRLRKAIKFEMNREPLPAFSSVGCYPIYYLASDGACLCAQCVNDCITSIDDAHREYNDGNKHERSGWRVIGADVNWEDSEMNCENCSKRIESAYAEDTSVDTL